MGIERSLGAASMSSDVEAMSEGENALDMRNRNFSPRRRFPSTGGERKGMALNNQNRQQSNAPGRNDGNVRRNYDRYIALAKDAASRGDRIEMENCYQHAEHYFRVMREQEK
jgi:hypothetical protein